MRRGCAHDCDHPTPLTCLPTTHLKIGQTGQIAQNWSNLVSDAPPSEIREGRRETETETDRNRDRETERQRETEGWGGGDRDRDRERQTDSQRESERGERGRLPRLLSSSCSLIRARSTGSAIRIVCAPVGWGGVGWGGGGWGCLQNTAATTTATATSALSPSPPLISHHRMGGDSAGIDGQAAQLVPVLKAVFRVHVLIVLDGTASTHKAVQSFEILWVTQIVFLKYYGCHILKILSFKLSY